DNEHYQLQITTPVGSKLATISVAPQQTIFTDQKNRQYVAQDPQSLLVELTGMELPLDKLHLLLLGATQQSAEQVQLTPQGYLKNITFTYQQHQSQVSYTNYCSKKRLPLPSTMVLQQ